MTKFKVGDKVRLINASNGWDTARYGDLGTIASINDDGSYEANVPTYSRTLTQTGDESCFELISGKPTKKQRLTDAEKAIKALEEKVAELEAKIAAIESSPTTPKTVPVTTDNIAVGDKVRFSNARRIENGEELTSGKLYEVVKRDSNSGFYVVDDIADDLYIATYEFMYVEKVVSA